MTTPRAIIFDLDGTLADTLADIVNAMNHVLAARGLATHDARAYRELVGEGARRLVERAAGEGAPVDALLAEFEARYAAHMVEQSAPYPGIEPLLAALGARGTPMAVLSNKPHEATRHVVSQLFPTTSFVTVLGQRDGVPRKPDPTAARELARALETPPADCALVGDTQVDVATAHAAGMTAIAVAWGFRSAEVLRDAGAHHVVDSPSALQRLLRAP